MPANADESEKAAFKKVRDMLGNPEVFVEPRGSDQGFPDFGFGVQIGKKKIDIHIEYKANSKAQMGSMRDWRYKREFYTNDTNNAEKETLLAIMNASKDAKKNADRLLADFKNPKAFGSKLEEISSGMLSIEPNKEKRRAKLLSFIAITDNYQIAKINNTELGKGVIAHYKKKFKKAQRSGVDGSILLMMIDNDIYLIEKNNVTDPEMVKIQKFFKGTIPIMSSLQAALEVRIQPRHVDKTDKQVTIDVMANFRLAGGLAKGLTI